MYFSTLGTVFLLALVLIGLAIAAMAIGVVFKRPCLRGSCGGPAVIGPDGDKISCSDCPNRTSSPPPRPGSRGRRGIRLGSSLPA